MPIKGRLFPSQTKQERVFLLIRKHWFVYVIFGMVFILMIIPVIAIIVYWSFNYQTISTLTGDMIIAVTSAFLLSLLGVQLYGFVDYYLDVYIVTDRRLVDIDQNGLFKRKISELHLHQVQDVEAKVEGIAGTLFHFGDVYIQTAGERENFIFRSVPHPYTVAKQIINLHEQQYQQDLTVKTGARKELSARDLSFGELESQAKEILRSQSFSKRISNPGLFPAPNIQIADDLQEDNNSTKDSGNQVSKDKEVISAVIPPTDSHPPETTQGNTRPKIAIRKVAKDKLRVGNKTKRERLKNATPSSEMGELKEGREVDLKD